MKKFRAALLVFFLFLALYIGSQGIFAPGQTGAGPDSPAGEDSQAFSQPPASASTATKAATTPVAGSLPPEPKWASLKESMSRDSSDLEFVTHPDGSQTVYGGGRFTQMAAGVRDASGRMVIQCFADYTAMDDALSGRTTPVLPTPAHDEMDYEVSDF